MSKKEVIRLEVIKILSDKKINQGEAGIRLGLSKKHVRRLLKSYQENEEEGLISKKRGKVRNNKISIDLFDKVVELISLKYNDFGPTLACEKLFELDNIKLSRESIR